MTLIRFGRPIHIISSGSAVGSLEKRGPLGELFDLHSEDDRFGCDTWEKSESESQHLALNAALSKAKLSASALDALFAGDLINQCTGSTFGLLDAGVPFFGLYGACSTVAEGLILASLMLESGHAKTAAAVTSSHYCSAERQFRTPLEYGAQRSPTSQRTVTGAGAFVLSSESDIYGHGRHSKPAARIASAMPGIVTDGGITDQSNMGAAMAPAALRTLCDFFGASKTSPCDYDLIVTGDLGFEGHRILCELSEANGYKLDNCTDCGLLIYGREDYSLYAEMPGLMPDIGQSTADGGFKDAKNKCPDTHAGVNASAKNKYPDTHAGVNALAKNKYPDTHAGGSGCGCSASVLAAYLLGRLESFPKGRMLFIATGALMSPLTVMQGLSIPGIAHLVEIVRG